MRGMKRKRDREKIVSFYKLKRFMNMSHSLKPVKRTRAHVPFFDQPIPTTTKTNTTTTRVRFCVDYVIL